MLRDGLRDQGAVGLPRLLQYTRGVPCGSPFPSTCLPITSYSRVDPTLVVLANAGTHLRPSVIPAPEPESRGGDLVLNPMSILPNMVLH